MIVEDDPGIRGVITRTLSRAFGAAVREVSSNDEALDVLANGLVDLIITDLIHVGPSGLELLESLRSSPRLKHIPVVVQSGQTGRQELACWRAGARGVLHKPFTSEQFITAVQRAIGSHRDPIGSLIELGTESPGLDYKGQLSLSSRDERAALAKDVIAFANYGGGQIIVGVAETSPGHFQPIGLNALEVAALEVSRVNRAIRRFLDPMVHISVRRVEHLGRTYSILDIPASTSILILPRSENAAAGLSMGRIYTRTAAAESAEVTSSDELRHILGRLHRVPRSE